MRLGLFLFGFMFFAAMVGPFFSKSEEVAKMPPKAIDITKEVRVPQALKGEIEKYLHERNWNDVEVRFYNVDSVIGCLPDGVSRELALVLATAKGKLHDFYYNEMPEDFWFVLYNNELQPINREAEIAWKKPEDYTAPVLVPERALKRFQRGKGQIPVVTVKGNCE